MRPAARLSALAWAVLALPFDATTASAGTLETCRAWGAPGSVEACRALVEQAPADTEAKRRLARSLNAVGDFEAAIEVYQAIAAAHPDDADALADLGGALGFVRRYAEAVAPMEKVMRMRPNDVTTYRAAAVIYGRLGRHADAVRVTRRAAELGDAIAMFDMAGFYRDGVGVEADEGAALTWAERAAEGGHLGAMALLTRIYLDGLWGQAVDEAKAKAWAWRLRQERMTDGDAGR